MKHDILKIAGLNALATTLYIIMVASFMFYAPKTMDATPSVFLPVAMLLLFVCSAALTGTLVFGRPALWYLDGRKKEAITLLFATLGILFGITLVTFVAIILISAK